MSKRASAFCITHTSASEHLIHLPPFALWTAFPFSDCRVGGGALGCPHASLRPPLKRSVQFSRTPLSQRHATSVDESKELVRSSVQGPTHRRDDVPAAVSSPDTATA